MFEHKGNRIEYILKITFGMKGLVFCLKLQ